MPKVGVVIPAGGKGLRFGEGLPKQFLLVNGVPILQRTISIFESIQLIGEIVVVVPKKYVAQTRRMVSALHKVSAVVAGGSTRQESVWNGLNAFTEPPDVVLVHDAVRPFISPRLVKTVARFAHRYGAAVVGTRTRDTIKTEGRKGFYTETLRRERLWSVQTPQGFAYELLRRAHASARKARYTGTDESSLVERLGIPVRIVPGEERNFKITTRQDFELAKLILKQSR